MTCAQCPTARLAALASALPDARHSPRPSNGWIRGDPKAPPIVTEPRPAGVRCRAANQRGLHCRQPRPAYGGIASRLRPLKKLHRRFATAEIEAPEASGVSSIHLFGGGRRKTSGCRGITASAQLAIGATNNTGIASPAVRSWPENQ